MSRDRMAFRDAMDLVPDDLPDGAYWAMAHEMAGLDYGDGFAELAGGIPGYAQTPVFKMPKRIRAKVEAFGTLKANDAYHWQVRKDGKVLADWWPHKRQWRIAGKITKGNETEFVKALAGAVQS